MKPFRLLWIFLALTISSFAQPKAGNTTLSGPDRMQDPAASFRDFSILPQLAWKFTATQPFFATPVIDKDKVYIGNNDSLLYCLDIRSGKVLWKFNTSGPLRSGVALDKDRLFLIGGDSGFYCLDKNTGRTNWTFRTEGERYYDQYDYYQSTPVLRGDTVFFGSGDGYLYALGSGEGRLIWKYRTGDVVHSKPALYGSRLYFGSFDGYTYALNTRDGSLVWKLKSLGHRFFPKGEMQFSPVVAGGLVFIGSRDFNLYAIDAEKGYCHWNRQYLRGWAPVITRTHHDSAVLVGTSDDKVLLQLRVEDGKEIWRTDVKFNIFGASALTADMCYTATLMGKLFGIDIRTGKIAWSFSTDKYRENRLKYFKSDDSYRDDIYSIIHSQEEYLAALNNLGAIYSTPAVDGDYIVFSSTEGSIYCLKRG
ncbi:MAG TPA: PQQ-binding-like beta-propeller repeat protein [Puia sp.]|nr:PQQ-binding-like beta-propeller repeat protein [Puia sp.]